MISRGVSLVIFILPPVLGAAALWLLAVVIKGIAVLREESRRMHLVIISEGGKGRDPLATCAMYLKKLLLPEMGIEIAEGNSVDNGQDRFDRLSQR